MVDEGPGIRTSKSGRVPQWVMDEALGKDVEPVPFRGATSLSAHSRKKKQRRLRSRAQTLVAVLLVGGLIGGVVYLRGFTSHAPVDISATTGVPKNWPKPGLEESRHRLLGAPAAPTEQEGTRYRFLQHQEGSKKPVTWDPCRPIHYVVRPDNAPPGGSEVLTEAVAEVSRVTGLKFVADGATTEGPTEDRSSYQPSRYGKRWAPVLVGWATAQEVPDFGIDVAGEAGPSTYSSQSGDGVHVSGTLMLSATDFRLLLRAGRTRVARNIVLHELGHLVGLAHSPDTKQLMYPSGAALSGYGPGDLAGLAALGRGPCQPDI